MTINTLTKPIQFTEYQCSLMMVAITEELKALEENYKNGEHSKEYFKEKAKDLREIYDLLLKATLNTSNLEH